MSGADKSEGVEILSQSILSFPLVIHTEVHEEVGNVCEASNL